MFYSFITLPSCKYFIVILCILLEYRIPEDWGQEVFCSGQTFWGKGLWCIDIDDCNGDGDDQWRRPGSRAAAQETTNDNDVHQEWKFHSLFIFLVQDSIAFPAISARNLKKKDIVLSEEFSNHVTLVLLWFRAIGQVRLNQSFVNSGHLGGGGCYTINWGWKQTISFQQLQWNAAILNSQGIKKLFSGGLR